MSLLRDCENFADGLFAALVMYLPAMEGDLSEDIRMRLGLCLMVLANLTIIAIFFHWNRATGSLVLCTLLMDI